MKLFKFNKKMAAAGLAVGVVLGAGGVAFAWFTSTGHGSGSASVGSSASGALAVSVANNSPNELAPAPLGDENAITQTVTYTVLNAQESDVRISTVTVSVGSSGATTACSGSWFSLTGKAPGTPLTLHPNVTLKPHSDATGNSYTGHFSVQLVESNSTQDACQGATPALSVSAK